MILMTLLAQAATVAQDSLISLKVFNNKNITKPKNNPSITRKQSRDI